MCPASPMSTSPSGSHTNPSQIKTESTAASASTTGELNFSQLGLSTTLMAAVNKAGYSQPTPIQQIAIPVILTGRDLLAQAKTGTGKTAAFGLPIINMIHKAGGGQALVITPTRELCNQVSDELYRFGKDAGIRTLAVYGGAEIRRQLDVIRKGVDIIVATPGRLLDFVKNKRLGNFNPQIVVLDEADEMMDMGFIDDITELLNHFSDREQTLLFSATLPREVVGIAQKFMHDPMELKAKASSSEATPSAIEQYYYLVRDQERNEALIRLIDFEQPTKALIFCRTKMESDELTTALIAKGFRVKALHGNLEQKQREEVIKALKDGTIKIVVATDVAARGLDIRGVSHVFNFHIPSHPDSYIHRIGRTGRAGESGKAFTLVTPGERYALRRIENAVRPALKFGEIPTLDHLKDVQKQQLISKINDFKPNEEISALYQDILGSLSADELALRLLGLYFNAIAGKGRSKIGLSKQEAFPSSSRDGSRGSYQQRGGPSRGSGGGYQRSSSERGGYRGRGNDSYRRTNDRQNDNATSGGSKPSGYGRDRAPGRDYGRGRDDTRRPKR